MTHSEWAKAAEEARSQVAMETFSRMVEIEKGFIKWPWYKRLFPWRIEIKVINLRDEERKKA